jgi:hypothetical protein
VIQLTPYISSPWPRLFIKNDPVTRLQRCVRTGGISHLTQDAVYLKKVKAHTPWAPKNSKELRLNVGDVIGVTVMHSEKVSSSAEDHRW